MNLALDADRAVDAVKWSVWGGKVTEFPAFYAAQLDTVRSGLDAIKPIVSSAQSTVQMIASGSASTGIQAAFVFLGTPLMAAPTFTANLLRASWMTASREFGGRMNSEVVGVRHGLRWHRGLLRPVCKRAIRRVKY